MRRKNILSLFSFFIIFLLIFTSFLMINVDAKIDSHIEYGGGVVSLLYTNNEHIVMNENGDELGIAFIGRNGDWTHVNFLYRDIPTCTWCEKSIRATINATPFVAIARDSEFNIHAIYTEQLADANYYLFYKFFQWSNKKWYLSPTATVECDKDHMGYNVSGSLSKASVYNDIKVDVDGHVYIMDNSQTVDLSTRELLLHRYNPHLNTWDLIQSIEANTDDLVYAHPSIALSSTNGHIYCTYSKNQDANPDSDYFDIWLVKSLNWGSSWYSPVQLVNRSNPYSAYSQKFIIDNSDIFHLSYYSNMTGSPNNYYTYLYSQDYGTSWDLLNVTDSTVNVGTCSLTKDVNGILYFTYYKNAFQGDTSNAGIFGKKYENAILGDEICIVNGSSFQGFLNLVWSNNYNQYSDSGIIGIYEDRLNANFDIRYLEMTRNDFILGQHEIWIEPDKLTYYTFDTITIHVTNQNPFSMQWRVIDSTGTWVDKMYKTGSAEYTDTVRTLMIPNGYTSGTWRIQVRSPWSESWGDVGNEYFNFTVEDSGLGYGISAFPSWVIKGNWVSCSFTAKKDESYLISLWYSTDPMGGEPRYVGNVTTIKYGVNQNVTIDYLFSMFDLGGYVLHLRNSTTGDILAMSNFFAVGDGPFENTYTVDIGDRYRYTDKPIITIHRFGSKSYSFTIYNENDILIMSHITAISDYTFQFIMDKGDIGTAYIIVHDADGNPSDSNAVRIEFQIYDPEGLTGDPIIDTFISIPTWIKAIVGVIIVLGFVFIPFILSQYIAGNHKLEVPPVIYAICGGIGVTLCTLMGLFGWEIMFFICVISGISLVISYVWQKKGD